MQTVIDKIKKCVVALREKADSQRAYIPHENGRARGLLEGAARLRDIQHDLEALNAIETRYILFAYDDYYPSGGQGDEHGRYSTIEEAKAAARALEYQTTDLLELNTGKWVWSNVYSTEEL